MKNNPRKNILPGFFILAFTLLLNFSAQAADTYTWINPTGNGNWDDASQWNKNGVSNIDYPGHSNSGDIVVINVTSSIQINMNSSFSYPLGAITMTDNGNYPVLNLHAHNITVAGKANLDQTIFQPQGANVTVGGAFICSAMGQSGTEIFTIGGNLVAYWFSNTMRKMIFNVASGNTDTMFFGEGMDTLVVTGGGTVYMERPWAINYTSVTGSSTLKVAGNLSPGAGGLVNIANGSVLTGDESPGNNGTIEVDDTTANVDNLRNQYTGSGTLDVAHILILFHGESSWNNRPKQQHISPGTYSEIWTKDTLSIFGSGTLTVTDSIAIDGHDAVNNGYASNSVILNMGSNNLIVDGDLTNNEGSFSSAATVTFNGSGTQIYSVDLPLTFNNLTMNNTGGGLNLSSGNLLVSGTLTLTDGIITSSGTNKFIMTSTAAVSGGSNSSYVEGLMENNALSGSAPSFIFPVGNSGKYEPIGIAGVSGAGSTFDAQYFKASKNLTPPGGATASTVEYWTLDQTSGSSSGNVTLYWEDGGFSGILSGDESDIVVYQNNGGSGWGSLGGTASGSGGPGGTGLVTASSVPSSDFSGTSYYTFGDNSGINPLPVTLLYFQAKYYQGHTDLSWATASEQNNDYFEIERSLDANSWASLGKVPGKGNSQVQNNYTYYDNLEGIALANNIYYRLKQVDFNGNYTYSNIQVINILQSSSGLNLYPDPVSTNLNLTWLNAEGNACTVNVYNMSGETVYSQQISHDGFVQDQVNLTNLPAGVYYVRILSGDGNILSGKISKN